MNHKSSKENEIFKAEKQFIITSSNVPMILYPQEKTFDDITRLVQLTVKIMFYKRINLVKPGLPVDFGAGNNGSIISSCAFVRVYLSW